VQNKTGTMSLAECNKNCTNPTPAPTPTPPPPTPPPHYGCNWANYTCVNNPLFPKKSLKECNATCQPPKYAACNRTIGKCVECKYNPTNCNTELAVCSAKGCKKSNGTNITGTWRGIQISAAFSRGEFDFTFRDAGVMDMEYGGEKGDQKMVWGLKASDPSFRFAQLEAGAPIGFSFTSVPSGGGTDPIMAKVGDKMSGVFTSSDGAYQITKYMYFAFGKPGQPAADSLDDGMTKLEFNMASCLHTKHCDFSSADVPAPATITY
jgi:hypothetical protein